MQLEALHSQWVSNTNRIVYDQETDETVVYSSRWLPLSEKML